MKKVRLHWTVHPEKDQEWYEREKARMTDDEVARELDINYNFSVAGTVFKNEFKPSIHTFQEDYEVNPNLPVIRAVDYGRVNAALFAQQSKHGNLFIFKELLLEESNTKLQAEAVSTYSSGLKCAGFKDFGDPAGRNPDHRTETTDDEIMSRYGINPTYYKSGSIQNRVKEGVQLLKLKLSERYNGEECIQISEQGCPVLIEAFNFGYRYKTDMNNQVVHKDLIQEEHPFEDVMDCLRYMVIELFDAKPRREKPLRPIRTAVKNYYTGH